MRKLQKLGIVCLCLILLQTLLVSSYTLAQEEPPDRPDLPPVEDGDEPPDRPDVPSNGDNGGGEKGEDEDSSTPVPPGATVSGFVYNYSDMAPGGGVKVIIDGGGWRAETISEENGYYRFGNLGSGAGILNLELPPGVHPVVFNWPVRLHSGESLQLNLGYYWGDEPDMPLLVSGEISDNLLTVQVEIRTGDSFVSFVREGSGRRVEVPFISHLNFLIITIRTSIFSDHIFIIIEIIIMIFIQIPVIAWFKQINRRIGNNPYRFVTNGTNCVCA